MAFKSIIGVACVCLAVISTANAAKLNVPQDFPGSFSMELLAGEMHIADGQSQPFQINTEGYNILFDAAEFNFVGAGAGSSALTLASTESWFIGSSMIFGFQADFYIDGTGTGVLIDNAVSTAGHWTLNTPMYATWNDLEFRFNDFMLTTDACYPSSTSTICGSAMDYETGDAYLVGYQVVQDGPFVGMPLAFGFFANDPPISTIPVPAAVWLFGSGLLALYGTARRKA